MADSERVQGATERHNRGYNCAQAVSCAFADLAGVDEETLFRATEGLGLGMGGMQCTCGALSGACVLAGLVGSDGNLEHPASKRDTYAVSRRIAERFKEEAGSTVCCELKGVDTGRRLLSCPDCVRLGARIAEEELFS
ncbi:MAG: C-GCAxxG-C-C family protein [Tractidigestivibacter sp.]|jgi:C_GCAxxG_C_C family probable redox protein|uniref:C-GCAxxG-C-C family protein n=1 Tax=Tractidigestivibacter sp. TaxID=2847320 RepID=UPI003D8A824B